MPTEHVGRVKIENQLNLSKVIEGGVSFRRLQTATAPYLNIVQSISSQLVGCKDGDCSMFFSLVTVSGADSQPPLQTVHPPFPLGN
jgi:hypothetical protein